MSLQTSNKQANRISRRLTVNTNEPFISIRPIIKKSDNETAYALAEAYADSAFLHWLTGSIKDDKKRLATYKDLFKSLIRTAANQSRDFAVQLNGCIGVMLWSEGHSEILTVGNVINKRKLWASLGGLSTMRSTLIHHRHLAKMKKRLMQGRAHLMLHFLGVLPVERNRQAGTNLLKHLLSKADEAQMPVFAEVWDGKHLKWLEKYGFIVEAEKNITENITLYYVVREPQIDPKTPTVFSPAEAIEALNLEPPRGDALGTPEEST